MKIISAGAVTSVGLSLPATTVAIRAGLDNFDDTQFVGESNAPIVGAKITGIAPQAQANVVIGGTQAQAHWAYLAIEECLANVPNHSINSLLVIVLCPDPSIPDLIDRQRLCHLINENCRNLIQHNTRRESAQAHLSTPIDGTTNIPNIEIHQLAKGKTGCVVALEQAQHWLVDHPSGSVVIVGVDSWLNLPRIQYGLQNERLLTESKAEGFVPSEAAAVILLTSFNQPATGPSLAILGLGLAKESASLFTASPCFGVGLAQATEQALTTANIAPHEIHLRLVGTAGEEYFFEEAAMAWSRLLRHPMPKNYSRQQPATHIGEVGVAFGPLLLGYAWQLSCSQRHPGSRTLVQLSSEQDKRAAIVTMTTHIASTHA